MWNWLPEWVLDLVDHRHADNCQSPAVDRNPGDGHCDHRDCDTDEQAGPAQPEHERSGPVNLVEPEEQWLESQLLGDYCDSGENRHREQGHGRADNDFEKDLGCSTHLKPP